MKKQGQASDGMVFLPRRIGRFALGEGEGFVPCKVQKSEQAVLGGTDLFLREKLLRRALQEEAESPEVWAWRRLMSLLLLWDGWETTDTLRFHDFDAESPLAAAILSTADETRRQEGLRVLCLHHGEQVTPIALGSKAVMAVPIPLTMQETWPAPMRRILGQENPCLQMYDQERILAEKGWNRLFNPCKRSRPSHSRHFCMRFKMLTMRHGKQSAMTMRKHKQRC